MPGHRAFSVTGPWLGTGAAAVALLAAGCTGGEQPPSAPTGSPTTATPTAAQTASPTGAVPTVTASPATVRDDRAELDVDDQRGDGRTVHVREVRLTGAPGHVAVFTADRSRLLGSARVARSDQESPVTVTLTQPVAGTAQLVAVLFADNGDGRLDPSVDSMVVDSDGDPEDEDFTYTAG